MTLESRGTQASVAIEDDGPGYDEASRARLGERFHRPPGSVGGGSGLGLSIVRAIAALHRGELELARAATGGARAVLWLPRLAG